LIVAPSHGAILVAGAEEKGGAEARAKVGQGGAKCARRVMRCGDWVRLGDAAADVVGGGHAASPDDG